MPERVLGVGGTVNTPKTPKTPERRGKNAAKIIVPIGSYSRGVESRPILLRLGIISGLWSHVEESIVEFFAFLIADTDTARPILRGIVSNQSRFKVMREVLAKSWKNVDRSALCNDLIDEYASINKLRNAYTHGLWFTHSNKKTYIREAELEFWDFAAMREVSTKELDTFIGRLYRVVEATRETVASETSAPKTEVRADAVHFGERSIGQLHKPSKPPS